MQCSVFKRDEYCHLPPATVTATVTVCLSVSNVGVLAGSSNTPRPSLGWVRRQAILGIKDYSSVLTSTVIVIIR